MTARVRVRRPPASGAVPALALTLLLAGGTLHAQFNYNYGTGWGGWGGTVQGDIAQGMGSLAAGAGQYNEQTAVANSINADTVMRVNQYMYLAQQEANRREYARNAKRIGRTNTTAAETADRLRNRPEAGDLERGDALNVLLDDLSAPVLMQGSTLRLAGGDLDASLVREIPFRNAAEAVTICVDQLTDKNRLPALLQSEAFASERDALVTAVRNARQQGQEEGTISAENIAALQAAGRAIYEKARSAQTPATRAQRDEALNFLKGMAALARIMENPDIQQAMKELRQIKSTKVANLIGFMHAYNLRFGPAVTAQQRSAYRTLYPALKADRDRIYATLRPEAAAPPRPPEPGQNPTEVFQGVDERHLNLPAPKP